MKIEDDDGNDFDVDKFTDKVMDNINLFNSYISTASTPWSNEPLTYEKLVKILADFKLNNSEKYVKPKGVIRFVFHSAEVLTVEFYPNGKYTKSPNYSIDFILERITLEPGTIIGSAKFNAQILKLAAGILSWAIAEEC